MKAKALSAGRFRGPIRRTKSGVIAGFPAPKRRVGRKTDSPFAGGALGVARRRVIAAQEICGLALQFPDFDPVAIPIPAIHLGAMVLGPNFVSAFTFAKSHAAIGMGAWLGTIMLINVWWLIWPNQKKILGMVTATDEEKNKARRVAFLASRANTMLSIPMLFFMSAGGHTGIYF